MVTKKTSLRRPEGALQSSENSTHRSGQTGFALITGASSGIGEALARCFAAEGFDVLLVARSADKLRRLAETINEDFGVQAATMALDLTRPSSVDRLLMRVKQKNYPMRVLVNCAGVLNQSSFTAIEPKVHQQMIDLNVSATTALMSAFIPLLVERVACDGGKGRILNVASIAAFQPIPMLATYAASKAFLLSLSESLAEELAPQGVTVTALCPGITATNMLDKAAQANGKLAKLPAFLVGDVQEVARAGMLAALRGDAICVPGIANRVTVVGSRATPKWLVRKLGGLLGRQAAADQQL